MNPAHVVPAGRQTAAQTCAKRGFPSFKAWAKENRKGHALHVQNKRPELAEALEFEFARFIRPNL